MFDFEFTPWSIRDGRVILADPTVWDLLPQSWNSHANSLRKRHRVFCTVDVFEDRGGPVFDSLGNELWLNVCERKSSLSNELVKTKTLLTMHDLRERIFGIIGQTPNLDWILLTKFPDDCEKMRFGYQPGLGKVDMIYKGISFIRDNVWIGTTVHDYFSALERIPQLTKIPAKVRFLIVEPLTGPVVLTPWLGGMPAHELHAMNCDGVCFEQPRAIDWVIVGGDVGPKARFCNIEWIRSIVKQCKAAGVPCYVKQLGSEVEDSDPVTDGVREFFPLGLKDPEGSDPSEWPEDLRVRELPKVGEA